MAGERERERGERGSMGVGEGSRTKTEWRRDGERGRVCRREGSGVKTGKEEGIVPNRHRPA